MLRNCIVLFACAVVAARELTDEEYHRLPRLFHLDDYNRCLSQKDGLYCLGTFHITPAQQPHPTFELIKEYIKNPHKFNRTLIRRGYCVSARCPPARALAPERNATLRFERCAAARARPHALHAALHTLHYCRTHHDNQLVPPPDTAQSVYLYVVYLILFLNFIGTFYDINTEDNHKKNNLIQAWSIRSNWRYLTTIHEDRNSQPALAPVQGARVILQSIIMFAHTTIIHHMVYSHNPEVMETLNESPIGVILTNGASVVQSFVVISSFLTGYNMLTAAQKRPIGIKLFFKGIIKRLFRIAPVYLLVVGYAATWWPRAGDGPMWSAVVGAESEVCRRKFWSHVLFINNLVESNVSCLVPSWSLAVDMQLYVVAAALTLVLLRARNQARTILSALFFAACLFNVILAYLYGWRSILHVAVPENIRNMFRYELSHSRLHMSTWGNLPACLLGLFLAHLYFERQMKAKNKVGQAKKSEEIDHDKENKNLNKESTIETDENKGNVKDPNPKATSRKRNINWLDHLHVSICPVYMIWLLIGKVIKEVEAPVVMAVYVGVERLVFGVLFAIQLIGFFTVDGNLRRFFAWKGWQPVARLALAVLTVHWCVNAKITVGRHYTINTSLFYVSVDWAATMFYTYLLAVPLTILVELPMQKFLDALIS